MSFKFMSLSKRQQRFLLGTILAFAGAVILLIAWPVWFPWVLGSVVKREGVQIARYERRGYLGFALHEIGFTNRSLSFAADRIEAVSPAGRLRRMRGRGDVTNAVVVVTGWRLLSHPDPASEPISLEPTGVRTVLESLNRWLPMAALSNGTLELSGLRLDVPFLTWSNGVLRAETGLAGNLHRISLAADLTPNPPYDIRIRSDSLNLESAILVVTNDVSLSLQGATLWRSNRIVLDAQFGPRGTLPVAASLRAAEFRFPAGLVQLPYYGDISGSLSGRWQEGRFSLDVQAGSHPQTAQTNLPPLEMKLHARGDTNAAVIETATLSSPWISAELSRHLAVSFTGPMLPQPARLRLSADLSRQPWMPLHGTLAGEAELSSAESRYPTAQFRVSGDGIGNNEITARNLAVEGSLEWPWLSVVRADATFQDGSETSASGSVELRERRVRNGHLNLNGPLLRQWLPPGYSLGGLSLSARFEGPLTNPAHQGTLEATNLVAADFQSQSIRARWDGAGFDLRQAELELDSGFSSLLAKATTEVNRTGTNLLLTELILRTNQQPVLELPRPCRISFSRGASPGFQVDTTPFDWVGKHGELHGQASIRWPREGLVQASGQTLDFAWFAGFLKPSTSGTGNPRKLTLPDAASTSRAQASPPAGDGSGPTESLTPTARQSRNRNGRDDFHVVPNSAEGIVWDDVEAVPTGISPQHANNFDESVTEYTFSQLRGIMVQRLHASLAWTNGPAALDLGLAATGRLNGTPISVDVLTKGDQHGLAVSNLTTLSRTSTLAIANGFLPLVIAPGNPTNWVRFDPQKPLQFHAAAQPGAFFWEEIGKRAGIKLIEPSLTLDVSGSWKSPLGLVRLQARQVELPKGARAAPTLENPRVQIELDRQQARLTEGRILVQGQPLSLTAQLPVGEETWEGIKEKRWPDLQTLSARLRIESAELASFAELFPTLLNPQGTLQADLSIAPGAKLNGEVIVQGVRTRPMPSIGPIRDLGFRLKFQEGIAALNDASMNIGGSRVAIQGQARLSGDQWLKGELPPLVFTVWGTNVPLSRQPDSIVRSDLNLAITKTNGAPPLISGEVYLRNSYYLSDLGALAPGKVATPDRRPPYFTVENPFLADWRLAVHVAGEDFLQVRSPIFNGHVSANLQLEGTLKDPMAVGDLRIDSGVVRFPFASLRTQQGFVSLTRQDPFHPQLSITASSRQFGYDIKMSVTGTADSPILQFTSTPPLSSEQILLMVTAGEMPQEQQILSGSRRAQALAVYLGRDVLSKFGFGDQAEERLTVQSGEEITQEGTPTYRIEYKLSDRWYVVGEYDRFNDYNVGLRWRIYSK